MDFYDNGFLMAIPPALMLALPAIFHGLVTALEFIAGWMVKLFTHRLILIIIIGFVALLVDRAGLIDGMGDSVTTYFLNFLVQFFSNSPDLDLQGLVNSLPDSVQWVILTSRVPDIISLYINFGLAVLSFSLFLIGIKIGLKATRLASNLASIKGV